MTFISFSLFSLFSSSSTFKGLLRLQQIYQGLNPGNETFQVEIVKRINNASEAIEFLQKIEQLNRWSRKYVVLDCPTDMAKEIVKSHVRDVLLGKRTYHYLLSGLVSSFFPFRVCHEYLTQDLFSVYFRRVQKNCSLGKGSMRGGCHASFEAFSMCNAFWNFEA